MRRCRPMLRCPIVAVNVPNVRKPALSVPSRASPSIRQMIRKSGSTRKNATIFWRTWLMCSGSTPVLAVWQPVRGEARPQNNRKRGKSARFFLFFHIKRAPQLRSPLLLENQSLNGSEITEPGKRLSEHSTQPCISPDQRRSAAERR